MQLNKSSSDLTLTLDFSLFLFFVQDMYNFLLDSGMDPVSADTPTGSSATASSVQALRYAAYLGGEDSDSNTIDGIMNGVVKEKLKIVPKDLK